MKRRTKVALVAFVISFVIFLASAGYAVASIIPQLPTLDNIIETLQGTQIIQLVDPSDVTQLWFEGDLISSLATKVNSANTEAASPGLIVNLCGQVPNINGIGADQSGCATRIDGTPVCKSGDGANGGCKGYLITGNGFACGPDNGIGWEQCTGGWAVDNIRFPLMTGSDGYYHITNWTWPLQTSGATQNDWVCKVQFDFYDRDGAADFIVWRDPQRCGSAE